MTHKKVIYFAGSIRGGRDDRTHYLAIIEELQRHGLVLTEHVGDENPDGDDGLLSDRQVYDRDIAWLKGSDCLIAEVTTPSLGVGFEIAKATEWGKPVLCLFRTGQGRLLSAMIGGCKDVVLQKYRTRNDLGEILDAFMRDV